jgi:UPF0176 protein
MSGTMTIRVAAFYSFTTLPHYKDMQAPMLAALKAAGVKGSVLLAAEGVNGTIAVPEETADATLAVIAQVTGISDIEWKFSAHAKMPFKRLKVKLRNEIVTIGDVYANPNETVGTYVEPKDWNALIADPDVVVVDTRNSYEYRIGTFSKAIDPNTETFGEFPDYVRKELAANMNAKIAMFCTGGIRCEKATSFMKHEGFENVYHLKGGILRYLAEVPKEQSLWEGACFVFDERVALLHGLEPSGHLICHGCLMPMTVEDRQHPKYEIGVCCPRCADTLTDAQRASNRERQKQFELAEALGLKHLGQV